MYMYSLAQTLLCFFIFLHIISKIVHFTPLSEKFLFSHRHKLGFKRQMKKNAKMQDICNKQTKTTAASLVHVQRPRHGVGEETYFGGVFISDGINLKTWSKRAMELSGPLVHVC